MALAADTRILTLNGWMPLDEASPSDEIPIVGGSREIGRITYHGVEGAVRVTFSDDTSVVCSAGHEWTVNTPSRRSKSRPWLSMTTEAIEYEGLRDKAGNSKWYVSLAEPPRLPKRRLPVHPYVLGYLLGNGGLTSSSPKVTIPDIETVERITPWLPEGVFCKQGSKDIDWRLTSDDSGECANPLLDALEELGVMGHGAATKTIPPAYLLGVPEDRLLCLQGLLDSDGTPSPAVVFTSASEALTRGVIELTQSLGGTATYRYAEEDEGLPRHKTNVALPRGVQAFLLSRKAEKYKRTRPPARAIASIEPVGERPMIDPGPVVAYGYVVA